MLKTAQNRQYLLNSLKFKQLETFNINTNTLIS